MLSAQKLIPAGSLIKCRVAEKISSKVTDIGDPVVCDVSRSQLPYGSRLLGAFQEYKDPSHLMGKGWMQLVFDRILMPPNRATSISAKV